MAVVFGGAKPPREIPPLSLRLSMVSGSVYTIPLEGPGAVEDPFSWTIGTLKFKDAAGREQSTQDTAITSIELVGGRVVYLTDIDFAKEDQVSFLGTSWPAQVNRNALGQPLRIKETYPRGIGVHTQSTLYYDLDGSFDQLAFRIGLDDSAAPYGEARASVVLDGKTLWQSDTLKPGVLSEEILLPIKGGKRLELHADPAARLDVQGRVDWINIALKRN
jgi:hypothetical protein